MLAVASPLAWMAYNAKQFGDPLDFVRGPYSAKAIEANGLRRRGRGIILAGIA